eukprot:2008479-Pleurochrysis_carterae.AAC.1
MVYPWTYCGRARACVDAQLGVSLPAGQVMCASQSVGAARCARLRVVASRHARSGAEARKHQRASLCERADAVDAGELAL